MTALSTARNTPQRGGDLFDFPAKAGSRGFQGGLAVLDGGYAAPARTATGLIALGRIETGYDNSAGVAGAVSVRVRAGVFKWANDATNAVAQTHVGGICYIVDDQTVSSASATNTRSVAGTVVAVEADGVWVKTGL